MKPRKIFQTAGIITATSILAYSIMIDAMNHATLTKSAALKNKQHAEQFVKKEQKKLKIEDKNIELIIEEKCSAAYAQKKQPNEYVICLNPEYLKEGVIKHEVYHIVKGHCDTSYVFIIWGLKSFFYNEPQAALYALWDIKL